MPESDGIMIGPYRYSEIKSMPPQMQKYTRNALTKSQQELLDKMLQQDAEQEQQRATAQPQAEETREPEEESIESPEQAELEKQDIPEQPDIPDPEQEQPEKPVENQPEITNKEPSVKVEPEISETPDTGESSQDSSDEEPVVTLDAELYAERTYKEDTLKEQGWQTVKQLQEILNSEKGTDLWKTYTHELMDIATLKAMGYSVLTHIEDKGERVGLIIDQDNNLMGLKFLRFDSGALGQNQLSVESLQSLSEAFQENPEIRNMEPEEKMKALGYTPFQEPVYEDLPENSKEKPKITGWRKGYQYGDPNNPDDELAVKIYFPNDLTSDNPKDREFTFDILNLKTYGTSEHKLRNLQKHMDKVARNHGQTVDNFTAVPFDRTLGDKTYHFDPDQPLTPQIMDYKEGLLDLFPDLKKSETLRKEFLSVPTPGIESSSIPKIIDELATNPEERYISAKQAVKQNAKDYNKLMEVITKYHPLDKDHQLSKASASMAKDKKHAKDGRLAFVGEETKIKMYNRLLDDNIAYEYPDLTTVETTLVEKGESRQIDEAKANLKANGKPDNAIGQIAKPDADQKIIQQYAIRDALNFPNRRTSVTRRYSNKKELPQSVYGAGAGDISESRTNSESIDLQLNTRYEPKFTKTGKQNYEKEYQNSNFSNFMSFQEFQGAAGVLGYADKLQIKASPEYSVQQENQKKLRSYALKCAADREDLIKAGLLQKDGHNFTEKGQDFVLNGTSNGDPFPPELEDAVKDKERFQGAAIGLAYANYDNQVASLKRQKARTQELNAEINFQLKGRTNTILRTLVNENFLPEEERPEYYYEKKRTRVWEKIFDMDEHLPEPYAVQLTSGFDNDEYNYSVVNTDIRDVTKEGVPKTRADGSPLYKKVNEKQLAEILHFNSTAKMKENGYETSYKMDSPISSNYEKEGGVNKYEMRVTDTDDDKGREPGTKIETVYGGISHADWARAHLDPVQVEDTNYSVKEFDLRQNSEKKEQYLSSYQSEDRDIMERLSEHDNALNSPNREFTKVLVDSGKADMSILPDANNVIPVLNQLISEEWESRTHNKALQNARKKSLSTNVSEAQVQQEVKQARQEFNNIKDKHQQQWKQSNVLVSQ